MRDTEHSTDAIKLSKQNKIFGTQWTEADALDLENYIRQNGIQKYFDKIGYTKDSSKEVAIQTKNGEDFTGKTFAYIDQLIKNRKNTGLSTTSVLGLGNDVDLFKNFSITDSNQLTGIQFKILKDATNKLSTQDQFGKLITFLRQDVDNYIVEI